MSFTMVIGRVLLPLVGAVAGAGLAWHWLKDADSSILPESFRGSSGQVAHSSSASPASRNPARIVAEGRVVTYPGARVSLSSEVLATILRIAVSEKSLVRKGDLLVELRDDDIRANIREARNHLIEAEVFLRLKQARPAVGRLLRVLTGEEPKSTENRPEDLSAAMARRDATKATIERLEAEDAKYRITAPINGVVITRNAEPGETVSPGSPLLTIADLSRLRIDAELDEFDIPRIALHAEAVITAEGHDNRKWHGEVEEIADSVAPRQNHPQDPSRPSDSRVLPVKIALKEPVPFKLGQRVEVEIKTATSP
jgi:HlyD family secretion protein